jgi:hypothetical protein
MNNPVYIFILSTLPSCGMSFVEPHRCKKHRTAQLFTESLVGHKQPCQLAYDKMNIYTGLFIQFLEAFDSQINT